MQKAKHAFGSSSNLESAIQSGKVDSFDILFLDGDTDSPKIGWLDKNGNPIIIAPTDDLGKLESQVESELAKKATTEEVDEKLATKVTAKEVDTKIEAALNEIDCAPSTYEKVKYEIVDAPVGTLVDYREDEIRILIPKNAQFTKQSVGVGGDPNKFYITLKTYVYNDDVAGYKEHLGGQVDTEILTDLKTDEYGRRYQPTWLGVATYDEANSTWSYYGANSSESKYIGWDYQLDMFDSNGVMIASDSVRINLSNENCHYSTEPYYMAKMKAEFDTKIAEVASVIEVIEF